MNELPRFAPKEDSRPDDIVWPKVIWPVDQKTILTGQTVQVTCQNESDFPELFSALNDDELW